MKHIILTMLLALSATTAPAGKTVTLDAVTDGTFAARRHTAVTPLPDGENYACLDNGRVTAYSYKTGRKTAVLFDRNDVIGETIGEPQTFILSPDASRNGM